MFYNCYQIADGRESIGVIRLTTQGKRKQNNFEKKPPPKEDEQTQAGSVPNQNQ